MMSLKYFTAGIALAGLVCSSHAADFQISAEELKNIPIAPSGVDEIDATLKHNRIDSVLIPTDGDYVAELIKLFRQR